MDRAGIIENEGKRRIEIEKQKAKEYEKQQLLLLAKGNYVVFSDKVYKRLTDKEYFLKESSKIRENYNLLCARCEKAPVFMINSDDFLCSNEECGLYVFEKTLEGLERGMSIYYMETNLKRLINELYDLYLKRSKENFTDNPEKEKVMHCERCKKPYIFAESEIFEERNESDNGYEEEQEEKYDPYVKKTLYKIYICSDSDCALSKTLCFEL